MIITNPNQKKILEEILSDRDKYYFEKTEISEIAPRPTTLILDILKAIYSDGGPVDRVYKKYRIKYKDTNFLEIIGNELFVDKEKELKGLLPGYSYFKNKDLTPKFSDFSKTFITTKNLLSINRVKIKEYNSIFRELKEKIEDSTPTLGFKTCLKKFLNDYEMIFEINLLSGIAIKKAEMFLKNEPINFSSIISGYTIFFDLEKFNIKIPTNLKGNSIDLNDEAEFMAEEVVANKASREVDAWWQKIPEHKKRILKKIMGQAIIYTRLREYGRWLTMKNINDLRNSILKIAETNKFENLKNIFFINLSDLQHGKINESTCLEKKKKYEINNIFSFPSKITSQYKPVLSKLSGVSSGVAKGELVNKEILDNKKFSGKDLILYTDILSPNLVPYLSRINGLISNTGGPLSHLAIVAREKKIPVVVGLSLENSEFKIGDNVTIDGGSGIIEKNR